MKPSQIIAFCEDCGEKNILSRTKIAGGMAVFKCSFCNYPNRYCLSETKHKNFVSSFLKKIMEIPEISGCFVFHRQNGVSENFMGKALKASELSRLGTTLLKNYFACLSCYDDIKEMTLVISDKVMVVKPIDSSRAVVIVSKVFPLPDQVQNQWKNYIMNFHNTGQEP